MAVLLPLALENPLVPDTGMLQRLIRDLGLLA